ncbi:MAG: PAS domain S-box protein [Nocardiopsis sp. BM-2018]|nr:MAG: PAS domain S-box protein [Nocardiopsis sp. BM-2018]
MVLSSELVELFDLDLDLASPLSLDEAVALFEPADRASIIDDIGRCLHDGTPIERQLHVLRPDGTEHWLRLLGAARSDETGRIEAVHGAIADITEQQTQIAMLDEQASLLDNASDSIIVQHLDGTVRYWNRSAERLYGWTSDEAVGRHIADLVDADERELFGEVSAALDRDGQWSGRVDNVDRHGRRITVDLHVNTLTGDDGRPRTVFSVARDVSAQIEIEQRLRQTQKLEALGQLAGGIAHDFNNLLTMIASSAELLGEIVGDDARTSSLIDTVLAATARGSDLTRRLLASARLQPLRPKVIDPVAAVDDGLQLVRRSLPETIDIVTRQPAERWTIEVDPAQLENAILNIALNARDAMEGRGRLTIAVEHVRAVDDATTNGAVRISISDSGHGMDDEVRLRVFDPFFTTKPIGAGSGLGLAMVHGFVQQSGGTIEIDSAPEVGTTVAMQFPRAESPIPDDRDSTAPGEIPRGDERLLVVEDDPLVRAQTVDSLRRLGYEVESVDHAGAALDRLERPDPRIDLVFSDVAMPGDLDGAELAEAISTRWPGLPVVLTSGHHDDQLASRIADRAFLAKPYRRGDLARAIREALDG